MWIELIIKRRERKRKEGRKGGNVLFNNALNTYGKGPFR